MSSHLEGIEKTLKGEVRSVEKSVKPTRQVVDPSVGDIPTELFATRSHARNSTVDTQAKNNDGDARGVKGPTGYTSFQHPSQELITFSKPPLYVGASQRELAPYDMQSQGEGTSQTNVGTLGSLPTVKQANALFLDPVSSGAAQLPAFQASQNAMLSFFMGGMNAPLFAGPLAPITYSQEDNESSRRAHKPRNAKRGPMDEMRQLIRILVKIFPQSVHLLVIPPEQHGSNRISETQIKEYLRSLLGTEPKPGHPGSTEDPPHPVWGLQKSGWQGYLAELFSWGRGSVISGEEARKVARREPGRSWEARKDELRKLDLFPECWPIPLTKKGVVEAQKLRKPQPVPSGPVFSRKTQLDLTYASPNEFGQRQQTVGARNYDDRGDGGPSYKRPRQSSRKSAELDNRAHDSHDADQPGSQSTSDIDGASPVAKDTVDRGSTLDWDAMSELEIWRGIHDALVAAQKKCGTRGVATEVWNLIQQAQARIDVIKLWMSQRGTYPMGSAARPLNEMEGKDGPAAVPTTNMLFQGSSQPLSPSQPHDILGNQERPFSQRSQ